MDFDEQAREEDEAEAVRASRADGDLDQLRDDPARHGRGSSLAILIAILGILGCLVLGGLLLMYLFSL